MERVQLMRWKGWKGSRFETATWKMQRSARGLVVACKHFQARWLNLHGWAIRLKLSSSREKARSKDQIILDLASKKIAQGNSTKFRNSDLFSDAKERYNKGNCKYYCRTVMESYSFLHCYSRPFRLFPRMKRNLLVLALPTTFSDSVRDLQSKIESISCAGVERSEWKQTNLISFSLAKEICSVILDIPDSKNRFTIRYSVGTFASVSNAHHS